MDKREAAEYFKILKEGLLESLSWYDKKPSSLFKEKSESTIRHQLDICDFAIVALSDKGYDQGYKDGQEEQKKKIERTLHLCASCINHFVTCETGKIVFGTGIGNDNVVECESFKHVKDFK